MLGLLLQLALIGGLAYLGYRLYRRFSAAPAAGQTSYYSAEPVTAGGGAATGGGPVGAPVTITDADYSAFSDLLIGIQGAWSKGDLVGLKRYLTPEMVSYFSKDLEENKANNDVNKVTDVKLLQGDLAEAWREGDTDYASVAMRYSLVDKTLDRTNGRLVAGSDQPEEVTEVWTFVRPRGASWELSAIQQT